MCEKEMYYIETRIRRADKYPAPYVLEETSQKIPYQNGTCLNLPNGMWVVVRHENLFTCSLCTYQRDILVVPVSNYEPVLNPEEGDDAVIGYYTRFHKDWSERVEVRRNPEEDGDRSLKYLEKNNLIRYY